MTGLRYYLIAVFIDFSWVFNSLTCILIDIVESFLSPKMNVIVELEFEILYFDVAVQHFSLSPTGTSP